MALALLYENYYLNTPYKATNENNLYFNEEEENNYDNYGVFFPWNHANLMSKFVKKARKFFKVLGQTIDVGTNLYTIYAIDDVDKWKDI